jgi:hypothetical protein
MAMYNVHNKGAKHGDVESALIVTTGRAKARKVFEERFGGTLADIVAAPVDTSASNGEFVYATWDSEALPEPTADDDWLGAELAAGGADTLAEADGEA